MTFEEWWKQTLWSQLAGSEREQLMAEKAFKAGRASMKAEALDTEAWDCGDCVRDRLMELEP